VTSGCSFEKLADFRLEEAQIFAELDVRQTLSRALARVLINPALGYLKQECNFLNSEKLIELLLEIRVFVENCESWFHLICIMFGPAINEEPRMTPKVTEF
jgi:hypothetical protein